MNSLEISKTSFFGPEINTELESIIAVVDEAYALLSIKKPLNCTVHPSDAGISIPYSSFVYLKSISPRSNALVGLVSSSLNPLSLR